jgi:CRISPR-associated protein Cas2
VHYLICYDIADAKRLRRAERIVSNAAQRLQDSLYASELSEEQLLVLQEQLASALDLSVDTVRFYPRCARDAAASVTVASAGPKHAQTWVV